MQVNRLNLQRGFTLVELTIAMAIFSLVLLTMTSGVIQLVHIYDAGHQIRDTQEAARSVSQQITDDTHDALALATGTENGLPSVCMFKTIQQQNNNLIGIEYYLVPFGTNLNAVHRRIISTTYAPPALPSCAGTTSDDHTLTSQAVTIKLFSPTVTPASNPSLLSLTMSSESVYAQQPGDFTTVGPFDQCSGGAGRQYCAITNIRLSALKHNQIQL